MPRAMRLNNLFELNSNFGTGIFTDLLHNVAKESRIERLLHALQQRTSDFREGYIFQLILYKFFLF